MTKKSRTPRTAAFKKKIALEALREDKTLNQLASEHGIHHEAVREAVINAVLHSDYSTMRSCIQVAIFAIAWRSPTLAPSP